MRKELDNPIVHEERTPREPHYTPCYDGIEISTPEEREAFARQAMDNLQRQMAQKEGERGERKAHSKAS